MVSCQAWNGVHRQRGPAPADRPPRRCALLRQPDRLTAALSPRRPGDECDLALYPSRNCCSLCFLARISLSCSLLAGSSWCTAPVGHGGSGRASVVATGLRGGTNDRPRWSGGGLVTQHAGQLLAAGDAELLVGPLQVAFHGPDRQLHVGGDLLVGPARRGLPRRNRVTRAGTASGHRRPPPSRARG